MSSHTAPDSAGLGSLSPAVSLREVSVRYRLPQERVRSLKEYAIRRLKKTLAFRDHWALRGVTLDVEPGEVIGIVGRNGAGKTTLMKVIARVLRPSGGRVVTRGLVAPLLGLGAGFIFELSGRENVFLSGATLGFSYRDINSRFGRIVEFAGLEKFIEAPLRTYSAGMVARLAFAIATDVHPDILLLDEILAVGDAEFRQKSSARIAEIRERGATVFVVSHSSESLSSLCSRIVWLEAGGLRTSGPTGPVLEEYEAHFADHPEQRREPAAGPAAGARST